MDATRGVAVGRRARRRPVGCGHDGRSVARRSVAVLRADASLRARVRAVDVGPDGRRHDAETKPHDDSVKVRRRRRAPRGYQPLDAAADVQLDDTASSSAKARELVVDSQRVQGPLDATEAGLQRVIWDACCVTFACAELESRLCGLELRRVLSNAVVSFPTWS